ncbi:MAG: hypothetical protein A2W05_07565 [Candidatus Schekmanbacteria bacterium RBG_16_38_10]|uniref:precorrin-2 dehydrogenase n=1 Tax=Candidatus Schekmanbacteria bacterium RBG_16_38_10 TaxID=1817879 RepID=A0A1F7RP38_9BACT|nr:MAG: hypothetical protein A2W05_07565 [Candidatus Schekmanbacteria bacterium RBG_16_38_10]
MEYYPVNLNIKNKMCIVIGGGKVAERKILSLLDCKADVTVISPRVTRPIKKLFNESKISILKRYFKKEDLKEAFLVVAATDNSRINHKIFQEANKRKILINVVDSPELCDFIMPSLIRRGNLLITISTGGKAPALSKKLRIMLEEIIGKEYEEILYKLSDLRNKLKAKVLSQKKRKEILEKVISQLNSEFEKLI